MKEELHTITKIKYGSKYLYRVKAQKGYLTFNTKKSAIKWVESFK